MEVRMKKLAIMLLVGCLLFVAISAVSAVEVDNFNDLSTNVTAGNSVVLKNNITPGAGESFGNGIEIKSSVTVDGNGSCIDANGTGRIFQIKNNTAILTLINITLKNGYKDNGGVIYSEEDVNLKCIGNVTFNNNTASNYGGAIYAKGGDVVINVTGDVTFNNNTASKNGGAICASKGVVINVTGDVTFNNNNASNYGGAIYAKGGDVVINVTGDVTFNNNNASKKSGGAICVNSGDVVINVTGDVTFNNNNAFNYGGDIYAGNGVVINVTGDVTFNNNNAIYGGAISAGNGVVINVTGDVTFNNNAGGAIYTNNRGVVINVTGDVTFNNNTASKKSGGAIYAGNGGVVINVTGDVIFNNNNATGDGGAIYASNRGVVINVTGDVCFINNTAGKAGGAILAGNTTIKANKVEFSNNKALLNDSGAIRTKGIVKIISIKDIVFENNFANSTYEFDFGGGAITAYYFNNTSKRRTFYNVTIISTNGNIIFRNNTANGCGGAIVAGNSTIKAIKVEFSNNTASAMGGAIDAYDINITATNMIFCYNHANYGGAIYGESNVIINVGGDVSFYNNTAESNQGGAIYSNGILNIAVIGDLSLYNNIAKWGGAIYVNDGNMIINVTEDINFLNNTAATDGGAIYISASNNVDIIAGGDVNFYNNIATSNGCGGAIYGEDAHVNIIADGNVNFYNNIATPNGWGGGAAIYTDEGDVNITATGDVNFCNNSVNNGDYGGAIFAAYNNVNINGGGDVSFCNNNANNGGAIYSDTGMVNITSANGVVIFENNKANNGDGGAIYAVNVNITNAVFYGNNATGNGSCIYLSDGLNSSFENCFWGLNYKNQTEIINDHLIAIKNPETGVVEYVAPDYWLLLNVIPPKTVICDINNTFKIAFNKLTNGTQTIDINPIIAYILVNLTEDSNKVPAQVIGYFNFTTDHVGEYTIRVINIYNGVEIINPTSFTVDNSPFSTLAEIVKENTTINLEKNYDYYNELDQKYANGIKITRNTIINGNGHYLDAKNLAIIFNVNKGVTLTLKNINLLNARIAIVNNGVLDLTNVTSKSAIVNNGIITSGVKFIVISNKVTTYDSFVVVLKTNDGIPIINSDNIVFGDDQGHTYKTYIYYNGAYVCYVPSGITGNVTFNNVNLTGYTNLTSKGSLDITKDYKSNKVVNSVVKNIKDLVPIVKNTFKSNKEINNVVSTVKNIITKSTMGLNTILKSFNNKVMRFI